MDLHFEDNYLFADLEMCFSRFVAIFGNYFTKHSRSGKKMNSIESSLDPIGGFFEGLNGVFECSTLPGLDRRKFIVDISNLLVLQCFHAI